MPHKQDIVLAATGVTLGAAPGLIEQPFYESTFWMGAVAIAGMTLLVLSAINAGIRLAITLRAARKNNDKG